MHHLYGRKTISVVITFALFSCQTHTILSNILLYTLNGLCDIAVRIVIYSSRNRTNENVEIFLFRHKPLFIY